MFNITVLKLFCYLDVDKCHHSDYYAFDAEHNVVNCFAWRVTYSYKTNHPAR